MVDYNFNFFQLDFSINATVICSAEETFLLGDITIREYRGLISEDLVWKIRFPSTLVIIMMLAGVSLRLEIVFALLRLPSKHTVFRS